jgi:RNA polymerase sigma factor (sigma-70 family)
MDREPRTDAQLLAATRDGDSEAFGELFERYYAVVLTYLARRTRHAEAAADLCGEVFARALLATHRGNADLDGQAAGWLLTIARNALIDSVRRGRVEAQARHQLGMERISLTDADLERIEEETSDIDRVVGELVGQLPEAQRAALKARVIDERDYADIGAEIGCSDLVVRQRVSRALKTLRSNLEVLS